MRNESTARGKRDRPSPVYKVSLEIEVWPCGEKRPQKPQTYMATEISLQGFYLRCGAPIVVPHRFNFAVLFPRRHTNENLQLILGVGRIVRREEHFINGTETFGLEAKIEQIDKMWEGEEEKAS